MSRRLRWVWLAFGHCCVALGAVGAFLPLLPTTPLLLLAAWAYARSSPALRAKLYNHPRYGATLHAWHEQGAIPRRAKRWGIGLLVGSWMIVVLTTGHAMIIGAHALVVVAVSLFILTRPEPRPAS